ncbi:tetratricopeptide repeat protein [Thiomicrorhabdus sp. Milos-T2]|uniref:tetratricopeptide repeat protein n=1 Tax=Thiomicrorhabdus sp. Milos-T2 TaxID=90814 RepID=UPI00049437C8|nr:tetratricopeptide repeat protein [Thiomicrorhabdus sp. Milos-T2]
MLRLQTYFLGCFLLLSSLSVSANLTTAIEAYASKDYQTAYKLFLPLAKAGDRYAQYGLAKMYQNGNTGDVSYLNAFKWYQKAAKQDYGIAQNNLGLLYLNGQGTEKNQRLAKHWFSAACENRCSKGCKNLELLEFEK